MIIGIELGEKDSERFPIKLGEDGYNRIYDVNEEPIAHLLVDFVNQTFVVILNNEQHEIFLELVDFSRLDVNYYESRPDRFYDIYSQTWEYACNVCEYISDILSKEIKPNLI